jgi:Uncharacterised nucleotidyltransferase
MHDRALPAQPIFREEPMTARAPAGPLPKLLVYAAIRQSGSAHQGSAPQFRDLRGYQLRQVSDAGLTPLLFRAVHDSIETLQSNIRDGLKSADLTARVRYANLCDAALEIIDACRETGVTATLLKGISIGDQHYPEGHLRPMGDIDVLVPRQDYASVESTLLRRGYVRKPGYEVEETAPHGAPLFDPRRRVWVEIHTALFPADARRRTNEMFGPSHIAAQTVSSNFHGRSVLRLSNELQLAYIASYWIRDLSRSGFDPSFVMPLLDAIYLLKACGQTLDWEGLLAQCDNELAKASLYVMLDYLSRGGFAPCAIPIVSDLAVGQRIVGTPERRILTAMLDIFLVGDEDAAGLFMRRHPMLAQSILHTLLAEGSHAGKLSSLPWNVVFPPWIAERYGVRFHRERIARLVKSKR